MRQKHRISRPLLLIGLPALLLACGGSDEPSSSPYAGSYVATSWTTTGNSGQQNQIIAGSTLQITLASNGTTTGHLHIAASGANPVFDADMAGTWTINGNVVEFTQAADTFVRDMLFTVDSNIQGIITLSGDQTFSGTRIQLTLTRAS
ncbi:MAG TPA: hypothetical protein VKB91_13555 [Gemmatimonadaceae bacterium]|nr:hypothetical protein [Gemmatimonadaceae bacterium]